MTTKAERLRKVGRGEWYDGDLDKLLTWVNEAWDAADKNGASWNYEMDVADLSKILTELQARRAEDK